MNNGNLLLLDNYMNVMMLERLVPKPVILAANLALSRFGLHGDVRDAVFRSMGVLNDTFQLRKVYRSYNKSCTNEKTDDYFAACKK
jgi:hypothetical protein